ncbi:lysylphosphatidylglycerol synthase transmembrane domain-containing protein [Methanohalophilus mahii]|uniref:Integral membrane protein n=1 Tax=Methanohalophilus mahii (strain ATCC 35705 / DSM 5219 / SLP) TaxID=547558 RepID=D5E9D6_METMS|nr:flippase-like domain-containing protein [Methanohalophilus mahii]ADE35787.1 conserved hypothetical protein [Methanohalophilus mahii DSM 5219]
MNKFAKWLAVSFIISIITMVGVFIYTIDPKTTESLYNIRPLYLLAAASIHMMGFVMWSIRTKMMAGALGYHVSIKKSFEIVTSSSFLASMTPSSVGGEPLRIHLLQKDRMPVGSATAVVLGERVLDAIIILTAAPFALSLFGEVLGGGKLDSLLMFGQLFLFFILAILLYAIWKPHYTRRFLQWVVNKCSRLFGDDKKHVFCKISEKVDTELEEFHYSIFVFLKEGRWGLLAGILFTFAFWFIEFSMLPVLLMGLNQYPSAIIVYAAQVLLMIVVIIPATPGSSGVAEIGATTLFSVFVPTYVLGIVVVAWRALTFYLNLLVGGFVSFKILKDTVEVDELLK